MGVGLQHKTIDALQSDLNLGANQLLPMFNKAMRKFTNMCKASYEAEIAAQLKQEEQDAQIIMDQFKRQGKPENIDETQKPDQLTERLQQEKDRFIQKHSISQHHSKQMEGVKLSQHGLVSLPRKREAESDLDDEEQAKGITKPDKKRKKR